MHLDVTTLASLGANNLWGWFLRCVGVMYFWVSIQGGVGEFIFWGWFVRGVGANNLWGSIQRAEGGCEAGRCWFT